MVDRFLEQQQAVCAVLAEDLKKCPWTTESFYWCTKWWEAHYPLLCLAIDMQDIHMCQWSREWLPTCWGDEVFRHYLNQRVNDDRSQNHVPGSGQAEASSLHRPLKKSKGELRQLLLSILGEKKGNDATSAPAGLLSPSDKLKDEFLVYENMSEPSAENDVLSWWKTNANTPPPPSQCARKYLCVAASSCLTFCFNNVGLPVYILLCVHLTYYDYYYCYY